MSDNVANFFLAFSHDTIIVPLMILGYIWIDRKIFWSAICLVLINMLFNCGLKVTFQVPLDSSLGKKWFAFPSGHMQSSVVFYVWLMLQIRSFIFKILIIILLMGIGYSLVHFGYHNYVDIAGAIFFGVLLILVYRILVNKNEKIQKWVMFSFSTILMLYMTLIHTADIALVLEHLWMAYYALIGIMISEEIFAKSNIKGIKVKILATILCSTLIFIVKIIFSIHLASFLPIFLKQLQWAIIGFAIPLGPFIAQKMMYFRNNREGK